MFIIPCFFKNLRICRHDLLGLFDEPTCFRVWKYIGNILLPKFVITDFDSFVTINPVPSREKVGNREVHIFCMLWPEATGEKVLSKMQCTKKNFARV